MSADQEQKADTRSTDAGRGLVAKVMIALLIAGVVMAEAAAVYFFLPSSEVIASRIRDEVRRELLDADPQREDVVRLDDQASYVEVDLGNFNLAIHQPSTNVTLNLMCQVMGTVDKAEQAEFQKLLANNANRLRERIVIEFRSADMTELTDPGLGLIKRRLLEKSNQLLGKPFLKSIMFPEYSYTQL